MPAHPHELAAPSTTQHNLELNDVVRVAPGGEHPDFPTIMGEQPIAKLEIGGGQPENTGTVYLLKVTDTAGDDFRKLTARAEAAGEETSDYLLAATYKGANQSTQVGGMAFLPHNERGTIIGREPGNVAWFDFGTIKGVDPRQWTPFKFSHDISRKQVNVTISELGVFIKGLTERSQTDITAPNMQVVNSAAEKRAREAIQRTAAAPQRRMAGRVLTRRLLRRG